MGRDTLTVSVSLLALATLNGKAPEWVQFTPQSSGVIKSEDGRSFVLDNAEGAIRASFTKGELTVDYNHATDLAGAEGHDAPAAAWIDRIAQHGPNNEAGLWAHISHWTPKAEQAVKDGEYRYLSPVIVTDKKTGRVLHFARAALTNNPALVMKGLFTKQETDLDRKQLCAALGLPETASDADINTAITKIRGDNTAMCAREKLLASAAGLDVSNFTALDDTTTTALRAKLKTPAAAKDGETVEALSAKVTELQTQLLTLTTAGEKRTAEEKVDKAIKDCKVTPGQRETALDLCRRDPAAFDKFVAAAPKIVSGDRVELGDLPEGQLSSTEQMLCSKLGLDPEKMKKEFAAGRTKKEIT